MRSEAGGTIATTKGSGKTNFIHLLLLKTQNNDLGGLVPFTELDIRERSGVLTLLYSALEFRLGG